MSLVPMRAILETADRFHYAQLGFTNENDEFVVEPGKRRSESMSSRRFCLQKD